MSQSKALRIRPLLEGPQPISRLETIQTIGNLDRFYGRRWEESPLIMSPSYSKFVNTDELAGIFENIGRIGSGVNRVVIIGFSMPGHDLHIVQWIYKVAHNYKFGMWNKGSSGRRRMAPWLIACRPSTEDERSELRHRYRFLEGLARVDWFDDGLTDGLVDKIVRWSRRRVRRLPSHSGNT